MNKYILLAIFLIACQNPQGEFTDVKFSPAKNSSARFESLSASGFELQSITPVSPATNFPHDAIVSRYDSSIVYVSGKGGTNVDGSFAKMLLLQDTAIVLSSYYGHGDQKDGETVEELTQSLVAHFCKGRVIVLNVSGAGIVKTQDISYVDGVVNGCVRIGDYIFGANKRGNIHRFYFNGSTLSLIDSYQTGVSSGLNGPHDIDKYGDYIVFIDRDTKAVKTIKVFNAGTPIPASQWTVNTLIKPQFTDGNRIRVVGNYAYVNAGQYFSKVDISNPTLPVYVSSINFGEFQAGIDIIPLGFAVIAHEIRLTLVDLNNMTRIYEYNGVGIFDPGVNTNFHDSPARLNDDGTYTILVTPQNAKNVAVFKLTP